MTGAQYDRLRDIRTTLRAYAEKRTWAQDIHPSPLVRQRFDGMTALEIELAADHVQRVMDLKNGQMAYQLIGAWHDGGEASVVRYVKGIIPQPAKV